MSKQNHLQLNYGIIGKRIRIARKEQGITQEALAKVCGISVTHLSHIENATHPSSLETLIHICVYLHVSLDDAFGVSASKNSIHQDCLDLFQTHSFDEQQLAMYMLKSFFTTLDIIRGIRRSIRLEDVIRQMNINFKKLPEFKLYEENEKTVSRPKKYRPEPMAADDVQPIKLPSGKKKTKQEGYGDNSKNDEKDGK